MKAITIIFEYGSFDERSSNITSGLLKIFVIGMFAHSANLYVTRFYYAMEKALIPVLTGVLAVFGVNVVIVFLFIDSYGASIIAWGTTIGAYFQLLVLIVASNKFLNLRLNHKRNLYKIFVLTIFLVLIGGGLKFWVNLNIPIFNVLIGSIVIVVSFIIISTILKVNELEKVPFIGKRVARE
jgi:putative peptidoglycan lipid II flippase